jgi:hypothetical protein
MPTREQRAEEREQRRTSSIVVVARGRVVSIKSIYFYLLLGRQTEGNTCALNNVPQTE